MFYSINICNFAAKLIFIVELKMDINDMLVVNNLNELGEFVTSEEFCKSLDEIFDDK